LASTVFDSHGRFAEAKQLPEPAQCKVTSTSVLVLPGARGHAEVSRPTQPTLEERHIRRNGCASRQSLLADPSELRWICVRTPDRSRAPSTRVTVRTSTAGLISQTWQDSPG
jgi:hypothetical protein